MRGRDRLAFRSNLGFCVPGVTTALVFPVKTNGPSGVSEENHLNVSPISLYQIVRVENAPGDFVAEKTAVLTPLGFPASAGCLRGVLEATQEDRRPGVFSIDLLFSLSCVASENLSTNITMCHLNLVPSWNY